MVVGNGGRVCSCLTQSAMAPWDLIGACVSEVKFGFSFVHHAILEHRWLHMLLFYQPVAVLDFCFLVHHLLVFCQLPEALS